MSDFRLRTLANFYTAAEARVLQSALEMQGIACTMNNAETVDNLWHLSNAVGGISVQVAEQDWEAAQAVIQAAPGGEPWVCPMCGAHVDAGFDLCWRCSADPQIVEVAPNDNVDDEHPRSLATLATADSEVDSPIPPVAHWAQAQMLEDLSRAWRCAVVGLGLCGLPNIYSMLLLLVRVSYTDLPQDVRWKFVAAFLVDAIVLVGLGAFLMSR